MVGHFCGAGLAEEQRSGYGDQAQNGRHLHSAGSVAAVVEEAEAELCIREVVALYVVLLDRVVDVVPQFHHLGSRTTALVLVSGYVLTEAQGAKAVAGDGLLGCNKKAGSSHVSN